MTESMVSLVTALRRWLNGSQGVRIEERRWRRSIEALHRDCDGLKRRIGSRQKQEKCI